MRRALLRLAGTLLCGLAIVWLAGVTYLYVFQRDFVFEPPSGALARPASENLDELEPVTLTAADGSDLAGWRTPPDAARPTILYFHGNAGDLTGRADRFRRILAGGYGLVAFSYRGYPGSDGSPSEAAFFADALEIFDRIDGEGAPVVLYGESMGTGVAAYVATRREAEALVLEAPFTAISDIAAETYPWVPVGILMKDQFRTLDRIGQVDEPLLVIHGTDDPLVPFRMGEAVFAAANEPKRFVAIEGGTHSDLWDNGLWPAVADFLGDRGTGPSG